MLYPFDRTVESITLGDHSGHEQSKRGQKPVRFRLIQPVHSDHEPQCDGNDPSRPCDYSAAPPICWRGCLRRLHGWMIIIV